MIAIFFYLLFFSILGIAAYVYLRQLQDKHIPKNKYDEAWDNAFQYKQSIAKNKKIETITVVFLIILVISYVISLVLSLFFWGALYSLGVPYHDFRETTWVVIVTSFILFLYIILFSFVLFLIWIFLSTVFQFLTISRKS